MPPRRVRSVGSGSSSAEGSRSPAQMGDSEFGRDPEAVGNQPRRRRRALSRQAVGWVAAASRSNRASRAERAVRTRCGHTEVNSNAHRSSGQLAEELVESGETAVFDRLEVVG